MYTGEFGPGVHWGVWVLFLIGGRIAGGFIKRFDASARSRSVAGTVFAEPYASVAQ